MPHDSGDMILLQNQKDMLQRGAFLGDPQDCHSSMSVLLLRTNMDSMEVILLRLLKRIGCGANSRASAFPALHFNSWSGGIISFSSM